jgi:hypothetical protein
MIIGIIAVVLGTAAFVIIKLKLIKIKNDK